MGLKDMDKEELIELVKWICKETYIKLTETNGDIIIEWKMNRRGVRSR